MRKWVVIAVVALVVAGALVMILWRGDPVEYHIREYRKAERKLTAPETFLDEVRDTLRKIRSKGLGRKGRLHNEMSEHRAELIRLGYLERGTFVVTNRMPSDVAIAVQKAAMKKGTNWEFFSAATYTNTNVVRVIAVKGMMPTWEEILNEMSQPEGLGGN